MARSVAGMPIGPNALGGKAVYCIYYGSTVPSKRQRAVCVYCASGPTHPDLLALAAELGEAIADRGWTLVWGGGNVSAMGALASAARARRARAGGNPQSPSNLARL